MNWIIAARRDLNHLEQRLRESTNPAERERLRTEISDLRSEMNRAICQIQEEVGWW